MSLPYSVILKSRADGLQYDLSSDIVAIPLCTDTGSGEVNTAVIILSGDQGKYITSTPIIDQFDQIKITLIDNVNPNYSNVFEVRKIIPQETKDSGTKLEVHMSGNEWNLQVTDFVSPFYFTDAYSTVKAIGTNYNNNKGSNQPLLTGHDSITTNKLPTWTTNTYDFGLNEDKCYNRITEVTDRLGASVDNGGVLDFFDIKFSNSFDVAAMTIFSSGSTPASPVTISNTNSVNIGETKGGIDSQSGTLVCSWGANGMGSLPTNYSRYQSRQIIYPLYKQWDSTVSYPQNAKVQWKGSVYLALTANSASQPDTHPVQWQLRKPADEYGATIAYSPWTINLATAWKNAGCNLINSGDSNTAPFGYGFWDGNLVLNDDKSVFRYPVDCIATSGNSIVSSSLSKFLYGGTSFYRGFRVLCLGDPTTETDGSYFKPNTGTGYTKDASGNPASPSTVVDVNGHLIKNSILQYDGTQWVVMYTASDQLMCSVIYNGLVYQFNNSGAPGVWSNVGTTNNGNDCFHPYDSIANVPGIVTDATFTSNLNSAIQVKYLWTYTTAFLFPNKAQFYKAGAWLNFRFPYPHNVVNSGTFTLGQFYGSNITKEPATLDSQNMHYTHGGNIGFNQLDSEDYGQLSSLDFIAKLDYQGSDDGSVITGEANFKMRCTLTDTEDNVVIQDFIIPFNGVWQDVQLPLSGFSIYRGVKPIWNPLDAVIPPLQVSATNVFNWRNIKNICIQTQECYDSSGRYNPAYSRYGLDGTNPNALLVQNRQLILTIDAFRFTKPLFVTSGTVSDRVVQTDFLQRPNILFYDQLKNDCLTELQKAQFRHKEFDITTTLATDISFGDSFYLNNPRIVSDSDSGANTIKLVAKRIEYSITKAENGQGGALRTLVGIKRFS